MSKNLFMMAVQSIIVGTMLWIEPSLVSAGQQFLTAGILLTIAYIYYRRGNVD